MAFFLKCNDDQIFEERKSRSHDVVFTLSICMCEWVLMDVLLLVFVAMERTRCRCPLLLVGVLVPFQCDRFLDFIATN